MTIKKAQKASPKAAISRSLRRFTKDEEGATAIEYGLIVSLVFVAIVGAINAYTNEASVMYNNIETELREASE